MPKGVSRSIEEVRFLLKEIERLVKEENHDISSACAEMNIDRRTYYHYNKCEPKATDQRLKSQIHLSGQRFLLELSTLCPILSTRTITKVYNNFFVPTYNAKLYEVKNRKKSPFPALEEINEHLRAQNFDSATKESNWRIYQWLKDNNLSTYDQRLSRFVKETHDLVREEAITFYKKKVHQYKENDDTKYKIYPGDFQEFLSKIHNRLMFTSIDIPVHFMNWLKAYANRNPKKAELFTQRLLNISLKENRINSISITS